MIDVETPDDGAVIVDNQTGEDIGIPPEEIVAFARRRGLTGRHIVIRRSPRGGIVLSEAGAA